MSHTNDAAASKANRRAASTSTCSRRFAASDRVGETVEAAVDELLADLACYPSLTGNTSITEGTVIDLLAALEGCENPYACPHGRPVIIELPDADIDARFERDYPGHPRPPEQ